MWEKHECMFTLASGRLSSISSERYMKHYWVLLVKFLSISPSWDYYVMENLSVPWTNASYKSQSFKQKQYSFWRAISNLCIYSQRLQYQNCFFAGWSVNCLQVNSYEALVFAETVCRRKHYHMHCQWKSEIKVHACEKVGQEWVKNRTKKHGQQLHTDITEDEI